MKGRTLSLADRLLLQIRGGGWHSVASLRPLLEPFLPPQHAHPPFDQQGLLRNTPLGDVVRDGCTLLIADVVEDLRRRGLLTMRRGEAGEEIQLTARPGDVRFDIDSEFESLLPRSPEEVAALESIILREGCRDPLVVWKQRRLLIDGHTRWRLLSLLGWSYEVKELEFVDRDAVIAWMWEQHCGRRNLTLEAKSYARGRAYNAAKQARGGDRKSKYQRETLVGRRVADELAKRYGVSRMTLYREARFAEALDTLAANCTPEIRQVVLSQAVRVTRKQVLRLAGLPQETQLGLVTDILLSRKPPRFPKLNAGHEVHLALPLRQPGAQARVLAEKLGLDSLPKLLRELKLLLAANGAPISAPNRRASADHAGNRARDDRFLGHVGMTERQRESCGNGSGRALPWRHGPRP